ncbi:MAG: hypothetical protein IJ856_02800 [Candidatus Methanomethylophilaceae archaeon]|nr:hypothetical protein [Candidatus Methanomethylophilaceae archaeon]
MGFLDKAINKTKSSLDSSSSKRTENKEVSKIESQIKEESAKVREKYEMIGKEYYRYTYDGDEAHKANFDKWIEEINESRKLIEECEAQIEEIKANGKAERENIKAEAEARAREIEEADQQAKAEKAKEKRGKDDLF